MFPLTETQSTLPLRTDLPPAIEQAWVDRRFTALYRICQQDGMPGYSEVWTILEAAYPERRELKD